MAMDGRNAAFSQARPGFSLIELLTVVAMAGLLMAIAARGFSGARDRSSNSQVESNTRQVQLAIEAYFADHDKLPAALLPPVMPSQSTEFLLNPLYDKRYLPGNRLPSTPWSAGLHQSNSPPAPITKADAGMWKVDAARSSATAVAIPKNPSRAADGGPPDVKSAAGRNLEFSVSTTKISYGVLMYEVTTGRSMYVLHGIGKRGRDAMVVGLASNIR